MVSQAKKAIVNSFNNLSNGLLKLVYSNKGFSV